jgi:hypothetical protein
MDFLPLLAKWLPAIGTGSSLFLAYVAWQIYLTRKHKRIDQKRFEREVLGRKLGTIGNDTHALYWFNVGTKVVGVNDNRLRETFAVSFDMANSVDKAGPG